MESEPTSDKLELTSSIVTAQKCAAASWKCTVTAQRPAADCTGSAQKGGIATQKCTVTAQTCRIIDEECKVNSQIFGETETENHTTADQSSAAAGPENTVSAQTSTIATEKCMVIAQNCVATDTVPTVTAQSLINNGKLILLRQNCVAIYLGLGEHLYYVKTRLIYASVNLGKILITAFVNFSY